MQDRDRQIAGWLLVTLAVALATVLVGYVANGAIRLTSPRRSATRGARVHLLVLGALLLLVTAWQHRLSQFALELPRPGVEVPGGYTDLHVQLPWMGGLVVVALFGAAVLLYSALRRSWAPCWRAGAGGSCSTARVLPSATRVG